MPEIIYLESMDSIRASYESPPPEVHAARTQLFVESLVNLAFGRSLVVQQSFAFDSYPFLLVLRDFKNAYDQLTAEGGPPADFQNAPIMLHLYQTESFKHAVSKAIRGMEAATFPKEGAPPFYSSTYHDLAVPDRALDLDRAAMDIDAGKPECFTDMLDDDLRADLFKHLWGWFGTTSTPNPPQGLQKVVKASPGGGPGITEGIDPILNPSSPLWEYLEISALSTSEPIDSVAKGLRKLMAAAINDPDPFRYRSYLYGTTHWHNSGATAEDIVGEDVLPLVKEVVNTMYNIATVNSIGIASASFTTGMVAPSDVRADFSVQELARKSYDIAADVGFFRELGTIGVPRVGVRIDGSSADTSAKIAQLAGMRTDPISDHAQEAFKRVLLMRASDDWNQSIKELQSAENDETAYNRALKKHIALLGNGLADVLSIENRSEGAGLAVKYAQVFGQALDVFASFLLGHDVGARALVRDIFEMQQEREKHKIRMVLTEAIGSIATPSVPGQ